MMWSVYQSRMTIGVAARRLRGTPTHAGSVVTTRQWFGPTRSPKRARSTDSMSISDDLPTAPRRRRCIANDDPGQAGWELDIPAARRPVAAKRGWVDLDVDPLALTTPLLA